MCLIIRLCGKRERMQHRLCSNKELLRILQNDEEQSTDSRGTVNSHLVRPK